MAKRYIVTGAAGHLGSTILRFLRSGSSEVRCLLRRGKLPGIVPLPLAKLAVPMVQAVARLQHRRPRYTRCSLYTLTSNSGFSSERAEKELGYRPRETGETIRDMMVWLTNGALPE